MKKLTILIAMLMAIVGCSKEVVPSDKLQDRGGLKYEINSQTPFTGIAVDYPKNDPLNLLSRSTYKDGKLDGLQEFYQKNSVGQNLISMRVNNKDGKIQEEGLYEYYHDNGQLAYKLNYKDGELDGFEEAYYEDGQLEAKVNYKDGELNGLYESYYENGQLREKGNYKNGIKDGLHESYYENGQLREKGNVKDGELKGLREAYDKNGNRID